MGVVEVLSDPSFVPPECLLELALSNGLKGLLKSPKVAKKTLVEFAVGEAELVLPLFEVSYPSDLRPRKAIQAARDWLIYPAAYAAADAASEAAAWAARASGAAAHAAAADAGAARVAAWAARAAVDAYWVAASDAAAEAAYWAREADPSVTVEDQIVRFLELLRCFGE